MTHIQYLDELKKLDQWVVWSYKPDPNNPDKPKKIPQHPTTRQDLSWNTPSNWLTYPQACEYSPSFDGLGFVLTGGDGYVGVDLDKCVKDGEVETWAQQIMIALNTYFEYSPSGEGLRGFIRGEIPRNIKNSEDKVEIYIKDRFLTVTGNHVDSTPTWIDNHQKALTAVWNKYQTGSSGDVDVKPIIVDSSEKNRYGNTLDEIRTYEKTGVLNNLLNGGNPPGKTPSDGDYATAGKLKFYAYTEGQAKAILKNHRRTARNDPEKLERNDYLDRTIAKAYSNQTEQVSGPIGKVENILKLNSSPEDKITFEWLGKKLLIGKNGEPVGTYTHVQSKSTTQRISKATGLDEREVEKRIAKLETERHTKEDVEEIDIPVKPEPSKFDDDTIESAREIIENGNALNYVAATVARKHAGDVHGIKIDYLSALSAQLTNPTLNLWDIGKSQKGKSHRKQCVLEILPNETYVVFTSSSPKSLFYYTKKYGEDALDGVLIFIDEAEASIDALPVIRTLTGQTEITPRHLSVNDAELLDLKITGKRAVWFTSVKTFGGDQLRNRFLYTNPDESEKQDIQVYELQDDQYRRNIKVPEKPFEVAQAVTKTIIESTKDIKVDIPYQIDWPYKERRFLYPLFLATIKLVAKTNYAIREVQDGVLAATYEDFFEAKELWKAFENSIIMRVSKSAEDVYNLLTPSEYEALTHGEIARKLDISTKWANDLALELYEAGLVNRQKRTVDWENPRPGAKEYEYWLNERVKPSEIGLIPDCPLLALANLMRDELKANSELTKSTLENNICDMLKKYVTINQQSHL